MTNPYEPPKAPTDVAPRDEVPRIRTSGLAIASLVFSAIPCCAGPGSLVGIGCGIAALRRIERNPTKYSGAGLAKAGIGIGIAGVLAILAFSAFMGNRYGDLKPVAESFVRHMLANDIEGAQALFVSEFRDAPDSRQELIDIREAVAMAEWGEFRELTWDWNLNVSGGHTTVRYELKCERGMVPLVMVFREENGEWRIFRFRGEAFQTYGN